MYYYLKDQELGWGDVGVAAVIAVVFGLLYLLVRFLCDE